MIYNKVDFWNNRSDPNNDSCRSVTSKHIEAVKPFLAEDFNVLEYGAGTGRMIELYSGSISFYDISDSYKDELIKRCSESKLRIDKFIIDKTGTIRTPFKDKEFDVVCAFEVLLHSPPEDISDLLVELSRISKKVIVITWYNGDNCSYFCWSRDYKKLLEQNNLHLVHWDELTLDNQVLFIYE